MANCGMDLWCPTSERRISRDWNGYKRLKSDNIQLYQSINMGDEIVRVEPYWYSERDCLGTGSFGEVYKGHSDQDKNQLMAIKRIRKGKLPQNIIDQEIQILQELSAPDVQHANFVTLLDCVQTEKHVYLVMEYCNGGDLDHYLREKRKMDESSVKIFIQQIASALKILHSHKVVHRDLKPANILLSHNGSREISQVTFKIADFGMGRFLEEGAAAQTFCGTPVFMAPEIFIPNAKYDYKADLWSIGAIVYNCLTGSLHSAFQKEPIKFSSTINPGLKELLIGLLNNDPKQRFSFNDFYYHPFIGMKEIEDAQKQAKAEKDQAAAAARPLSPSEENPPQSGCLQWLRRVFSIRRKPAKVTDDKVKILEEGSSSNPASPSQPLSPKARGGSPAANANYYTSPTKPLSPQAAASNELSPGRRNSAPATPEAKTPSPKRGFFGFFQSNPAPLKPIQEAISTHLMKSLVLENRDVYGVAHLDMRYYVLCRSPNVLLQYSDQSPFIKIKDIDISKHVKLPQDMTACNVSKCLYVTDIENSCVWKVELGYPTKVTKWASDVSAPHTVSVNARSGQVTTFGNQSKSLRVYATNGDLVNTVPLPGEARFPQHAVETSRGNFIVSYGELKGKKQGVCEVSPKGKVTCRYEHKLEKVNHPTHLAIDADDKVFVADNANNRVLQLDARLKFEQSLPSEEKDKLEKPFRLCYASRPLQKRLLVEHRINTVDIFNVS